MTSHRSNPASAELPKDEVHRPGDVIAGRYVLDRRLGQGGMGVVWAARSKALGVDVALKLLHESAGDSVAVERMAREAHAAARIGHSAIVRVFDFGESEGRQPFLAMELLEGEDLAQVLKRQGSLTAVQAVSLLLPVIDGLAAAHHQGIVHRDLKPENIFVARGEFGRLEPKVLDFGIAKLDMGVDSRLTHVGAVLGSPAYLSPEQAEGADSVDHRTDVWSLGVVLYHLVTAQLPFEGRNYNALMRSITQDQPLELARFVNDDELRKIIGKCLEKVPARRYASMRALGAALAQWLLDRGVTVDASSRSVREIWLEGGASSIRKLFDARAPGAFDGAPHWNTRTGSGTTHIRPTRRRSRAAVLAVAAGGLFAVLAAIAFFRARLPASTALAPASSKAPSAPVSATAQPPSAPPVPPSPESAVDRPAHDTPPKASSTTSSKVVPKRSTKPTSRPKAVDTEFGF